METFSKLQHEPTKRRYVKGNYECFIGDTLLNLKEVYNGFAANGTFKVDSGNDTKFVLVSKSENGKRVTLRTRGRHGPTIEFNLKFPTEKSRGVIKKYRIKGKFISKQLHF